MLSSVSTLLTSVLRYEKGTSACCSVLQRVAACCSVLQCVAVCCSALQRVAGWAASLRCLSRCLGMRKVCQCVAVSCSMLQCVAACCSLLQCSPDWTASLHYLHRCKSTQKYVSVLQCVVVNCSVLQCVVVTCSVLQCVVMGCKLSNVSTLRVPVLWSKIHIKRDFFVCKETYSECKETHTKNYSCATHKNPFMKTGTRNLFTWLRSAQHIKRDLFVCRETYLCAKRPSHVQRDLLNKLPNKTMHVQTLTNKTYTHHKK